jgi:hypothetical protein
MGGEPARMEIEMIPDNDKRIDVAKLREAVKVILEYETEMEEPQQWYDLFLALRLHEEVALR